MPTTPYQTDQERRELIGKILSSPHATTAIVDRLHSLSSSLYDAETSPVEERINKVFIPTNIDFDDEATNSTLIKQTLSPLYEEITAIICDVLNDKATASEPQLLDKRLRPFVINSFFSNRWNETNLPTAIVTALRPFQDNSLVKDVLRHRLETLHRETTLLTAKVCATDIIRYNMYKFVYDHYEMVKYLADTNPSVVTLYIYTQDITKPIEHQGEIVKTIRDHLESRHPDYPLSSYWKAFTKRSHQSIYNHITACSQQNMQYDEHTLCTELMIATTISGTHLEPTPTSWLDHMNDNRFTALQQRKPILMLLLKEIKKHKPDDEWFQGVGRQITDISDFARDMNPDAKVTSTSWNGLLARSDEWHRDQRANHNLRQHDPDRIQMWNSLIKDPVVYEEDNIVVIPLLSSMQLYAESDEVQHCVRAYSEACSSGRSRIFKIRPIKGDGEREKIGTMEIDLNNDAWKVRQVRGIRNHPMSNAVEKIAVEIAQQYTKEWNTAQNQKAERHTTWVEQRTDNKKEGEQPRNRDEI